MLCGIDEAGRGPLAGPLVMAGVILEYPIDGLNDSKKLSQKRRDELYKIVVEKAQYHIVSYDATFIDKYGISKALSSGLESIKEALPNANYLFDGNSTFGVDDIQTKIRADAYVPQVSAASILAKVTRDREMHKLSKQYPKWEFHKHKGYGTKAHIEAIREHGYSPVHRLSYKIKSLL